MDSNTVQQGVMDAISQFVHDRDNYLALRNIIIERLEKHQIYIGLIQHQNNRVGVELQWKVSVENSHEEVKYFTYDRVSSAIAYAFDLLDEKNRSNAALADKYVGID